MDNKLFAVYLGGRAPKCNTELHDVVFVAGETIEATYARLLDKWFGAPERLHLDSWIELDIVDGHRVTLSENKPDNGKKLYFLNLGAYRDGHFMECHATAFIVADSIEEAKQRGKNEFMEDWAKSLHTDDLLDLDDCLELGEVDSRHIRLTPTDEKGNPEPHNGYHPIPKPVLQDYLARRIPPA